MLNAGQGEGLSKPDVNASKVDIHTTRACAGPDPPTVGACRNAVPARIDWNPNPVAEGGVWVVEDRDASPELELVDDVVVSRSASRSSAKAEVEWTANRAVRC